MVLSLDLGLSDSKTQPSACGANAITYNRPRHRRGRAREQAGEG